MQDFFEGLSSRTYRYVVVKYNTAYLLEMNSPNKYSETDIIRMVELFIDNIYVEFCGHVYKQTVGIPSGTNCAPLVADLFLYQMKADFVHLQKSKFKKRKHPLISLFTIYVMIYHWITLSSMMILM